MAIPVFLDAPLIGGEHGHNFSCTIRGSNAWITWGLYQYEQPLTHVLVRCCVSARTRCKVTKVRDTRNATVRVDVPQGGDDYTLQLDVFDGDDLLLTFSKDDRIMAGAWRAVSALDYLLIALTKRTMF